MSDPKKFNNTGNHEQPNKERINDMTDLQIFDNIEFGKVRAAEIDGIPLAAGVDVARALGYAKPSQAVIDHCTGIRKLGIPHPQTNQHGYIGETIQETNMIPESDIYRLIFKAADQSRNPAIKEKAERFQKWIFEEILPSIRKNGIYVTKERLSEFEKVMNDPDAWIAFATAFKEEKSKNQLLQCEKERLLITNERLQEQIERDKDKISIADALTTNDNSTVSVTEFSKLLQGRGIDIRPIHLYEELRQGGFLIKKCLRGAHAPTQAAINACLFTFNKIVDVKEDGSASFSYAPRITAKGQQYLVNYFLNRKKENVNTPTDNAPDAFQFFLNIANRTNK
jgi:prophage antirepressor-like protein